MQIALFGWVEKKNGGMENTTASFRRASWMVSVCMSVVRVCVCMIAVNTRNQILSDIHNATKAHVVYYTHESSKIDDSFTIDILFSSGSSLSSILSFFVPFFSPLLMITDSVFNHCQV